MKIKWRKPNRYGLELTIRNIQKPQPSYEGWDPFLMEIQADEIDWDNPIRRGISNAFKPNQHERA